MKRTIKILFLATLFSTLYLVSCSRGNEGTEGKYPSDGTAETTEQDNTDVGRNDYNSNGSDSRNMNGQTNGRDNGGTMDDGMDNTNNNMNNMSDTIGSSQNQNGNYNGTKTGTSTQTRGNNNTRPQSTTTTTTTSKKTYSNPNSVTE